MDAFRFDVPCVLFIGRFLMAQPDEVESLEWELKAKPFKLSNSYALGLQVTFST